jgi:predicted membrane channel-forming protein YqfA (hemolysin III family)
MSSVLNLVTRPGAGCPWHTAREAFGYPNIKWCEQPLCSIIEEPANTWSNLAYLIVALIIIYCAKKENLKSMFYFGVGIFLMGLFSLIYHATNNWPTQLMDFVGMYFYTGAMILYNFRRMELISKANELKAYIVIFILNMLLIPLFQNVLGIPIQLIVAVNVLTMLIQEYLIRKKDKTYQIKFWWLALITITIAETLSILDAKGIFCNPEDHVIQGHALWHVIGAISNYFTFLFYKQFVGKKL